jgi:hypothetical protein
VLHLEATLETNKGQNTLIEKELGQKCKDLEHKLELANTKKEEVYKNQMKEIQDNLTVLKEQIQSTN